MSDGFHSLTDQVKFWNNKPEELEVGASITGKVVLIQEARNAKSSRTATLELENGEKMGVWLSTVIDGAFRAGVHEGDTVRVTYNGKKKGNNGPEYNDYSVDVKRAEVSTEA